ncbi:sulfotransferase family 2 domain-containing protein [Thioclava sp. GXIMD4216]|uniref:sulfotransferase family 2 domain-containing protein n=1 Tax=Thioclava sp. GXIMD4216 TaxID=3131929 RepID=UPI0030D07C0E
MPLLQTDSTSVFFAHVPKTGGTSVEDYLQQHYGPLSLYDPDWLGRKAAGLPRKFPCSEQHLVWADARTLFDTKPDLVFGLVRDPLQRAISEYRFQARSFPHMQRLTQRGFSVWLAVMEAAYRRDPYVMDNHLRPQSDFLPHEATVFRLEEGMEPVVDWLQTHLGGVAGQVPHAQKSAECPTLQDRIAPSKADMARITRLYHKDYVRFGYQHPIGGFEFATLYRPAPVKHTLYAMVKGRKVTRAYRRKYI